MLASAKENKASLITNREALKVQPVALWAMECAFALTPENQMDFKLQGTEAVAGIKALGIWADAVIARIGNDWSGLAYIIGMALKTRDPIKYGLLFAVADIIDGEFA